MGENKQYVRKQGGFNFASAMLSYNIGTDGYIRHMTGIINRFLFNDEHMLSPIISGDSFCIIYNNKIVLSNNFDFVESCRAVSFREFEKILIKLLEGEGCIFDKGNYYYESIMAG